MKKVLLVFVSLFVVFAVATAQDYKQAGGDKSLEVQFAPLGGNPIGIGGIAFRSFSSEAAAIRLNIFAGYSSKTDITQQADGDAKPAVNELKDKSTSFEIGLRPGYEKHMTGTDRMSPYMGAELDIAYKSTKDIEETDANYTTDQAAAKTIYKKTTKGEKGFLRFGVNAFAGFEYYFAKKLYVGAELGLGLAYTKNSKIKVTDESAAAAAAAASAEYKEPADQKQGADFNFGPTVNSQIKLGFLF